MVILNLFVGGAVVKAELLRLERLPRVQRGQWMKANQVALRNAAWWVRNSRISEQDESRMIAILTLEVKRLLDAGESLESVVPSLVDLFLKP